MASGAAPAAVSAQWAGRGAPASSRSRSSRLGPGQERPRARPRRSGCRSTHPSNLVECPGAANRPSDPAVSGWAAVGEGQGIGLGAVGSAFYLDEDGPLACPADLAELARWAGLQRRSFAPGRLSSAALGLGAARVWSNDAAGWAREGSVATAYRPTTRDDAVQAGAGPRSPPRHQSNQAGRRRLYGSTVPKKPSAATRSRVVRQRANVQNGGRCVSCQPVDARSRPRCGVPLFPRSTRQEERQMGIEKRSCEVSVPDGAPRMRPGQRPDSGLVL